MTKRYLVLVLAVLIGLFMVSCSDPEEDDVTAPGAPVNLTYDENLSVDGKVYISWTAPSDDDVESYNVYRNEGSGDFTQINSVTRPEYEDLNLDYTITYNYKVTAVDDSGNESPFSNMTSVMPFNQARPASPENLEVKAYNLVESFILEVKLTWNANGEGDFDHYKIYRSASSPSFQADPSTLLDSTTDTSYPDQDVEPGIKYYYKLRAVDRGGLDSDPTFSKSDTPLEIPVLVRPIDDAGNTSLTPTFEWTHVQEAVKYKIVLRTSPNDGNIWTSEIAATGASTLSITYPSNATTALIPNDTRYWWFIAAYSQEDGDINAYSEDTTFKTQ